MDFAIDTHFHIWDLHKFTYPWPTPKEKTLYRDVPVTEYDTNIKETPVKYGIFIQVLNNSLEEAKWVLEQAKHNPCLKGVVAGLDLTNHEVLKTNLKELGKYPEFLGCRHILDFEQEDWIERDDVRMGIEIVGQHGYTFDLLLRPHLLKYIPKLLLSLPSQKFVIDHIAKPYIKDGKMEPWKSEMAEIAKYPNVYCKISGLVTEADLKCWKPDDFRPYVNHIIDIFGSERCMFGSDWSVCSMAGASFKEIYQLAENLLSHLTEKEKQDIFKNNAVRIYNLRL